MGELILKEQETREQIVKLLNESNLPAFVLEPILRDMHEQVSRLKEQQYNEAKALQEQKKEEKKEEVENGQD